MALVTVLVLYISKSKVVIIGPLGSSETIHRSLLLDVSSLLQVVIAHHACSNICSLLIRYRKDDEIT